MIDPSTAEQEEVRHHLLQEQERYRQQAILDYWVGMKLAREANERRDRRELKRDLDPFNWGHWGALWTNTEGLRIAQFVTEGSSGPLVITQSQIDRQTRAAAHDGAALKNGLRILNIF
jgi:hypothetical protein